APPSNGSTGRFVRFASTKARPRFRSSSSRARCFMRDSPRVSAHVDQFVRQRLPPADLWPRMEWSGVPELAYPDRLNCAEELLDRWIAAGDGDRIVFHHAAGSWSYRRLFETANRI